MFCRKCGQQISEGNRFCTKCGTPAEVENAVQKQEQKLEIKPKTNKTAGILVVGIAAVMLTIGGVFAAVKSKENTNNKDSDRLEKATESENLETNMTDTENTEIKTSEVLELEETKQEEELDEVSLVQYAETLEMCDLNGAKYHYYIKDGIEYLQYTDGLRGYKGCLAYKILDIDSDGQEELVAFDIRENSENGNDIYAQVYEQKDGNVFLADEEIMVDYFMGAGCDLGAMRMMIKDNKYICADFNQLVFLSGDGWSLGAKVLQYDGEKLDEYVSYEGRGSAIHEIASQYQTQIFKLKELKWIKTAENLELRDDISLSIADGGFDILAKIRVQNSHGYSTAGYTLDLPVATCYLLSGNEEEEYIFPHSSEEYLTEEEVSNLDKATLRIARNEIYARYGWSFKDEQLKEYFENKSWYLKNVFGKVTDDQLSEIEKANRDLIAKYENMN